MTKGDYARLRGVSPGRISQYIADGQIGPNALEGEGRNARIIVDVADRHLAQRLHMGQATGANGKAASTVPASDPGPLAQTADAAPLFQAGEESHLARAAKARAEQEEIKTARMRREEQLTAGRYMLADDARAEMNRIAASVMAFSESAVRDIAVALAAETGAETSVAIATANRVWRERRARMAETMAAQASAMPATQSDAPGADMPSDKGIGVEPDA